MVTKHLDLGCGSNPRNPYNRDKLYGIDLGTRQVPADVEFAKCNVSLSGLPFNESVFDSVSAFDFLEHVPRLLAVDGATIFPFIRLMNEIYRVLKPNGIFCALTPAYPKVSAFVDPTHVNAITSETHKYFTEPHNWGQMYGFNGTFSIVRVGWCNFDLETKARHPIKKLLGHAYCHLRPKIMQHFIWEFVALK